VTFLLFDFGTLSEKYRLTGAKQQVGIRDARRDASRLSRLNRSQFALLPIRARQKRGENTIPVTVKYNLTFVIARPLHAV
jgi:hypothetical protein